MIKIATTQLWVHDQDEALAFYTEKLGFEVRSDVTLPEMGDFRWLTVSPAGQEDVAIVLMAIPGAPMFDDETRAEVVNLMSKGYAGTVFLTTDDCQASYEELQGQGGRVHRDARGPSLRHRRRLPRPVGQPLPPDPGPRDRERVAMCLYHPPSIRHSPVLGESAPQDRIGDRAPTGRDGQDLELRDVLPVRDPALQERDVLALHHLEHAA